MKTSEVTFDEQYIPPHLCETLSIFSRALPTIAISLTQYQQIGITEDPILNILNSRFVIGMSCACDYLNWDERIPANRKIVSDILTAVLDPNFFNSKGSQLGNGLLPPEYFVLNQGDFEEWARGFMLVTETYNLMQLGTNSCNYSCCVGLGD